MGTWNCPAGYAGPAQCSGAYTIGSACGSSRCDCYRCYDQRFVRNSTDSKATQLLHYRPKPNGTAQQAMQVRLSAVALTPLGPPVAAADAIATGAMINGLCKTAQTPRRHSCSHHRPKP